MTRPLSIAALLAAGIAAVSAQTPPPAAAPAPMQAPPAPAPPTPPPNYAYSVDGRRDPFVALLGRTQRSASSLDVRAEGLAGLMTDELVVRGILQSRGSLLAMVSGPAGRVYTVHPGDRIADGVIRSITPQALVILQQVNDPLSLEKQREVRKFLRGGDTK